MADRWMTNTAYISGFKNKHDLFEFVWETRMGRLSIISDRPELDLEYLTMNIACLQNQIRLSISFLSSANIAEIQVASMDSRRWGHLKMTYAVIDTRSDAVELYSFMGPNLISHKSVPKGLGKPLREELERLPDPTLNVSISAARADSIKFEDFDALISPIVPPSFS